MLHQQNTWQFTKRDFTSATENLYQYFLVPRDTVPEKVNKAKESVRYEMRFDVPTIERQRTYHDKAPSYVGGLMIGLHCAVYYDHGMNRIWLWGSLRLVEGENRKALERPQLHGEWDGNRWNFEWLSW